MIHKQQVQKFQSGFSFFNPKMRDGTEITVLRINKICAYSWQQIFLSNPMVSIDVDQQISREKTNQLKDLSLET